MRSRIATIAGEAPSARKCTAMKGKPMREPTSRCARLFRDRRGAHLQEPQPRQPDAIGARVRRQLHVYHRRHLPGAGGARRHLQGRQHLPHYDWAAWRRCSCRRAAGWSASSCWTRRSICRASIIRGGRPTCWDRRRDRCRRRCSRAAITSCKIPTSFCINVAMAGAIVMYDRVRSLGRFEPRPLGE